MKARRNGCICNLRVHDLVCSMERRRRLAGAGVRHLRLVPPTAEQVKGHERQDQETYQARIREEATLLQHAYSTLFPAYLEALREAKSTGRSWWDTDFAEQFREVKAKALVVAQGFRRPEVLRGLIQEIDVP